MIVLEMRPMPAPRPRVTKFGTYNDPRYTAYKQAVALQCRRYFKEPISGAVKMELVFQFKTPKSWSKKRQAEAIRRGYHTQKPDGDNLEKGIKDALNGIAYIDDAQVAEVNKVKVWGDRDMILIDISSLEKQKEGGDEE